MASAFLLNLGQLFINALVVVDNNKLDAYQIEWIEILNTSPFCLCETFRHLLKRALNFLPGKLFHPMSLIVFFLGSAIISVDCGADQSSRWAVRIINWRVNWKADPRWLKAIITAKCNYWGKCWANKCASHNKICQSRHCFCRRRRALRQLFLFPYPSIPAGAFCA